MSVSNIIKNIYTFVNILAQVRTEVVRCWDEKSLQNACNWARYCMKVEEQTRDKLCRVDLNRHVQSMVVLVRPLWLRPLHLDMLKDALTLLYQGLADNPQCPPFIRNHLAGIGPDTLKHNSPSPSDCHHIDYICNELIGCNTDSRSSHLIGRNKPGVDSSYLISGEEYLECCDDECRRLNENNIEFDLSANSKAALVMERLFELHGICVSCEDRFFRYIEKVIEKFKDHDDGYAMICDILLTDLGRPVTNEVVAKLKQFIMRTFVSGEPMDGPLWRIELHLLCNLADQDDWFLHQYIQHLTCWADSMEPIYGPTDQGNWYEWRYKDRGTANSHLTFENLIQHVEALLFHSNHVRQRLEPMLQRKCNQSCFNVWTEIQKSLHTV